MSKQGHLRLAVASDAAWLSDCAELAYSVYVDAMGCRPAPMDANFALHIERKEAWVWQIPTSDGAMQAAGYAVMLVDRDCLYVDAIALLPSAQGKGAGRRLMAACEARGKEQGCHVVKLYTNAKMLANQRFYPALGYQVTGRSYQDGFDRIFYAKPLDA